MEEIKTTQEQLAKIDMLDYRLRAVLYDLNLLRKSIEASCNTSNTPNTPLSTNDTSIKEIYKNLKKHRSSRSNLRSFCKAKGINTLEELLKVSPSEFIEFKGIGPKTLYDVRVAIESLGIVWSDAK